MSHALSEEEKVMLAIDIRGQMSELNRKLEQLGLNEDSGSRVLISRAPDGGPSSQAHRHLKANLLATTEVILKTHPDKPRAIITSTMFDPDLHERVEVTDRRRTRLDEALEESLNPETIEVGSQSKNELSTMVLADLKKLPEAQLLKVVPEKKDELVAAILKIRERLKATA
jgi:hypothetical protein